MLNCTYDTSGEFYRVILHHRCTHNRTRFSRFKYFLCMICRMCEWDWFSANLWICTLQGGQICTINIPFARIQFRCFRQKLPPWPLHPTPARKGIFPSKVRTLDPSRLFIDYYYYYFSCLTYFLLMCSRVDTVRNLFGSFL